MKPSSCIHIHTQYFQLSKKTQNPIISQTTMPHKAFPAMCSVQVTTARVVWNGAVQGTESFIVLAVGWLVGCLTSQQQASVSQGRICSDNFTCCHTEIVVADQTFYLTQSQYTDTGPTSPSADPITPGAWQGSHWSANF